AAARDEQTDSVNADQRLAYEHEVRSFDRPLERVAGQGGFERLCAPRFEAVVQLHEDHVGALEPLVAARIGEQLELGSFDIQLENVEGLRGALPQQLSDG